MVEPAARGGKHVSAPPVAISVRGLTKAFYDDRTERVTLAVRDIDLTIHTGEFVCLVGPSGCGKTTILRMIAGLEAALDGEVVLNSARPPGMVFQEASVLPWLPGEQDDGFPLSIMSAAPAERNHRLLGSPGCPIFAPPPAAFRWHAPARRCRPRAGR